MNGSLTVRVVGSMREIAASAWDACAAQTAPCPVAVKSEKAPPNPFVSHAFLLACESSGSAIARTGWAGSHVLVEDEGGALLAAAPCYLKSHSMGEYVFDWSWAEAFERVGGAYYPKLQVCVPFTPVQGPRLLLASGERAEAARQTLLAGLKSLRARAGASSLHVTFPVREQWEVLGAEGFLRRTGRQFHFFNRGYADFDGFLASLASRKRKMIRRERQEAVRNGIEILRLSGSDLKQEHWDAFFAFYMDTGSRKWGRPYLTREFFSMIGEAMADRILLVMAKRNGRWIAGALNFIGADALYGRNWGCVEEAPFLHFEVCYYQAIEFALERRLARVEAGAQGEHKLARGYEPVETYSAHDIADKRLERAVADFLRHERSHNEEALEVYAEHVPFRRDLAPPRP